MESGGKLNLLMSIYLIHLTSLMQPLSSCLDDLYEMPQITAFFRPWSEGGGPGGAWEYGDGGGAWDGMAAAEGVERGSGARWVMA